MCCAIRKTLRSYRRTSSSKAESSPALAARTSASSSLTGPSSLFWMAPMVPATQKFARYRSSVRCLATDGPTKSELLFYLVTSHLENRVCGGRGGRFALEFQKARFVPHEQVPKSSYAA